MSSENESKLTTINSDVDEKSDDYDYANVEMQNLDTNSEDYFSSSGSDEETRRGNRVILAKGVTKRTDATNDSAFRSKRHEVSSLDKNKKGVALKWIFRIFRHPISRNMLPFAVLALNLLIYNEDPISYSEKESKVYLAGRVWNYFFRQYPPSDEGLWITFKAFSLFVWIVIGALLGKYLIHNALLRDCFDLKLFQKDMGSWPVMFVTTSFVVFLGSYVYNAIVSNHFHLPDGLDNRAYVLSDYIGIKEYQFGKIAVTLCWFCDYFNVFVINDSMLQDAYAIEKRQKKYGCARPLAKRMQRFWNERRKPVFYVTTFLMFMGTFFYVGSDWEYGWFMFRKGHFGWNQYGRSFLCSFIIALDVCMFMQDWDFPKFKRGGKNVKILGCNERFGCRSRRFEFKLEFNGKWINFGALIVLIMLDTNLFFNQVLYSPSDYDQLVDGDDYVRNVFGPVPTNFSLSSRFFDEKDLRLATNFTNVGPPIDFDVSSNEISYNYTNENGTVVYVYCVNATLELQRNASSDVTIAYEYKCYNVSESFNIKFVDKNTMVMISSAIPVAFVLCLCFFVFVFIVYNNGRCNSCDLMKQNNPIVM